MEDFEVELKLLQTKYSVLERNYLLLQKEKEFESNLPAPNQDFLVEELRLRQQELKNSRDVSNRLQHKLFFVRQHLSLQKKELNDLKVDSEHQCRDIFEICKKSMLPVLQRLRILEANYNLCMDDAREHIASLMSENQHLIEMVASRDSQLRDLRSDIVASEESISAEREKMRLKCLELASKIGQLESIHAQAMDGLRVELQGRLLEVDALKSSLSQFRESEAVAKQHSAKLSEELKTISESLFHSQVENKTLTARVQNLTDQFDRLSSIHEAVQSDLDQARRSECALRSEISSFTGEKGSLQARLRSIQAKVSEIELSRDEELKKLANDLQNAQRAEDLAKQSSDKFQKMYSEFSVHCDELTRRVQELENMNRTLKTQVTDQVNCTKRAEESVVIYKKKLADIEKSSEGLRNEREEFEKSSQQLSARLKEMDKQAREHSSKLDLLNNQSILAEQRFNRLLEMKSLEVAAIISEKDQEIKDLKETIRRECEERTEMLIHITEMKDKLRMLSSVSVGTADRESAALMRPSFLRSLTNSSETDSGRTLPDIHSKFGNDSMRVDSADHSTSEESAWMRSQGARSKKSRKPSSHSR